MAIRNIVALMTCFTAFQAQAAIIFNYDATAFIEVTTIKSITFPGQENSLTGEWVFDEAANERVDVSLSNGVAFDGSADVNINSTPTRLEKSFVYNGTVSGDSSANEFDPDSLFNSYYGSAPLAPAFLVTDSQTGRFHEYEVEFTLSFNAAITVTFNDSAAQNVVIRQEFGVENFDTLTPAPDSPTSQPGVGFFDVFDAADAPSFTQTYTHLFNGSSRGTALGDVVTDPALIVGPFSFTSLEFESRSAATSVPLPGTLTLILASFSVLRRCIVRGSWAAPALSSLA